MDAARRYRVDTEKLRKAVVEDLPLKRNKRKTSVAKKAKAKAVTA